MSLSITSDRASSAGGLDRQLVGLALVVALGGFMSVLDTTIVNVAINSLSKEFNAPLSTIQWVATGYTLALAMVIPLTGWGVDRYPLRSIRSTTN